jgi:hypothetical protein
VDYGIYYKVDGQRIPAMFVEIKPLSSLSSLSSRANADLQIRERFEEFFDGTPSAFMFGLSAFGPRICLYSLYKKTEESVILPERLVHVRDTAPLNRWNVDLMTDEGYMEIFNRVKQTMKLEG